MEASAKPKTYEPDEIEAKLKEHGLDDWYVEGDWIRRKYKTSGWKGTLMVVHTVGHLAEAAWHHPDLTASYAWVEVRLMNHAATALFSKHMKFDAADPHGPDRDRFILSAGHGSMFLYGWLRVATIGREAHAMSGGFPDRARAELGLTGPEARLVAELGLRSYDALHAMLEGAGGGPTG